MTHEPKLHAITVLGHDRPGIIAETTAALAGLGLNLEDSTMTLLRGHFAMMLLCAGEAPAERIEEGLRFAIRESYAAGSECANVGTITTTLPDGTTVAVDGVYTYRVGDDGRVVALRAFWEFEAARLLT